LNFIFLVYHICTPTILGYVCFNLNAFEILVDFISCYSRKYILNGVIVAFAFGVPAKTKQVEVQPTRVVKQVVYRAPKPLTPAEQKAEIENVFATIATDKINKNLKGIKIKTNITKDGWSANVIDKKDKIQIKIGVVVPLLV
jgi:hypothetical protein